MFKLFNLFKKKKIEEFENAEETPSGVSAIESIEEIAEKVLNCSKQINAFEDLNIYDRARITEICINVATSLRGKDIHISSLVNSYVVGFGKHGVTITQELAKQFASVYIETYLFSKN